MRYFLMVLVLVLAGCSTLQDLLVLEQPRTQGSELRDHRMEDNELVSMIPGALKEAGWKQDIVAASIPAKKWLVVYKSGSDAIEKRIIPADVLVKEKGQTGCVMVSVSFKQLHDGTAYGPTVLNATGDFVKVDCETAIVEAVRF